MAHRQLVQSSSLTKKQIKNLCLTDTDIFLTCIVIYKSDPKFFGDHRGVLNLTLRDTVKDYLNCVIWDTEEKINEFNDKLSIGSILNVENPKITKEPEDKKQFHPKCSSNIVISVNSKQGKIISLPENGNNQLLSLLRYPIKNTKEILKLSDISLYDKESVGESVDLLVAIRYNRPSRELFIAKMGVKRNCKTLIVMDRSFPGMSLDLWSKQGIARAENWRPLETILFISDVRIGYSEYYQAITLSETARTIFVENPVGQEAEELTRYVRETHLQDIEQALGDDVINTAQITDVMTVQQIMDKADGTVRTEGDYFTAICYGVITKFDIDGLYDCVRRRCELCEQYISLEFTTCLNEDCYNLQYMNPTAQQNCVKTFFHIIMNISDHTGTLVNCKLYNKSAEKVMCVNVNDFIELSDEQKGLIKWNILLERCLVKLVIRKRSVCRANPLISVVECTPIDPNKDTIDLKIY